MDLDTGGILEGAADAAKQAGGGVLGELGKLGKSAFSQFLGGSQDNISDEALKNLDKKDKDASALGQAEIQARIRAYYVEHEAKRKREAEMVEQEEEVKEEEKKMEEINAVRVKQNIIPQIEKSRAENKNYGSE